MRSSRTIANRAHEEGEPLTRRRSQERGAKADILLRKTSSGEAEGTPTRTEKLEAQVDEKAARIRRP